MMIAVDLTPNNSAHESRGDQLPSVEELRMKANSSTRIASIESGEDRDHDQLPSVEEAKAQVRPVSTSNRYACIILAVSIPLILIAVIVTGGVVYAKKKDSTNPYSSSPTKLPKDGEPDRISRVYDVADFVGKQGWSDSDVIYTPSTPQWKAAVWVADFDEMKLPIKDSLAFRQRYALATFYFALGGRDWSYDIGWLSDKNVCEWAEVFEGVSESEIRVGISCECNAGEVCDRNTVKKIFLPSLGLKGEIPIELSMLSDVAELNLYRNGIKGEFPKALFGMEKLHSLVFHNNEMTGKLPEWIGDMTSLSTLNLASNEMTGALPVSMVFLHKLVTLNLNNNMFDGKLDRLEGLKRLQALILDSNEFTGNFSPDLLLSWPNIEVLDLSENKLEGSLPDNLFDQANLLILDLHGNRFKGAIPEIKDKSDLFFMALHDNELSGTIPSTINNLKLLQHLDLSNNELTGDIPDALSSLVELEYLFLAFNGKLKAGPIPSYLDKLENLVDLSLKGTSRTGTIPDNLALLDHLYLLDLDNNSLTGTIPELLGSMEDLRFILINNNKLNGTIPDSLALLENLDTLLLDGNDLTGSVQPICDAKGQSMSNFIADCDGPEKEVDCTCCSICCKDDDYACNDVIWFADQDPVWENKYVRQHYSFHEADVIYPVPYEDDGPVSDEPDYKAPLPDDVTLPDPTPAPTKAPATEDPIDTRDLPHHHVEVDPEKGGYISD